MPILPRPVSPRSALADLRDMFSPDRPHRWSLLALSFVATGILLWGFMIDSRVPPKPREIIYVESWMSDRKDSDIIRQQIKDLAAYEAALQKKQREFQKMADGLGIEWREQEKRSTAQRKETMAAMDKILKKRLADALAREAAEGGATAGTTAAATTSATAD